MCMLLRFIDTKCTVYLGMEILTYLVLKQNDLLITKVSFSLIT